MRTKRGHAEDGEVSQAEPCFWELQTHRSPRFVYLGGIVPGNDGVLPNRHLRTHRLSSRGLKENVIRGRLIPAGTGMEYYRNVDVSNAMKRSIRRASVSLMSF